jgi:hypothetical protein
MCPGPRQMTVLHRAKLVSRPPISRAHAKIATDKPCVSPRHLARQPGNTREGK